jgi:uroporphyrinogen III methyltransferase/synthase
VNPTPDNKAPDKKAAEKKAAKSAPGGTRSGGGLVALVGIGPGDEGLLTLRAATLLAEADLVVAAPWVSERIEHRLRDDATVVDSAALEADPKRPRPRSLRTRGSR